MGTQEFYIRAPAETESHGPYTLEQLVSLAEAGRIDNNTLYYDATSENWLIIVHNPHLKALLFPEKQRLTLRPKDTIVPSEPDNPGPGERVTVEEMLAAADARTEETKGKRSRNIDYERAAQFGRIGCLVVMLISAFALTLPAAEIITQFDVKALFARPQVILGLLDFVIAVVLLLGSTEVYPLVRFRAAIGVGFFGLLGWLQGHHDVTIAVTIGAVGLYLATVSVRMGPLLISLAAALVGTVAFAYLTLTT